MREENVYEIDLREIFHLIRVRIRLIIVCGVIGALLAGIFSFLIATPMYSSTSKLYILTQSTSITSLADIQMGSSLAYDYIELIKSRPVVEGVIEEMELDMSYEDMLKKMTVENPTDTRILKITITDEDPAVAMEITNSFSEIAKRQISEIMKTDEPSIVEKGVCNKTPVSPEKKKNVAIGLLLGLLFSVLYVIIRHMTDDTIKGSDDVQKYLDMDTIAVIPIIPEDMDPAAQRSKKIGKLNIGHKRSKGGSK